MAQQAVNLIQNQLLYPNDLDNAAWAKVNSTGVTVNADTNPITGLVTVDGYQENTTNAVHYIEQTAILPIFKGYMFCGSAILKKGTRDFVLMTVDGGASGVWMDLNNGTLGVQSGGSLGTIEDLGNGFHRCTVRRVVDSTIVRFRIYATTSNGGGTSYAGVNGDIPFYSDSRQVAIANWAGLLASNTSTPNVNPIPNLAANS